MKHRNLLRINTPCAGWCFTDILISWPLKPWSQWCLTSLKLLANVHQSLGKVASVLCRCSIRLLRSIPVTDELRRIASYCTVFHWALTSTGLDCVCCTSKRMERSSSLWLSDYTDIWWLPVGVSGPQGFKIHSPTHSFKWSFWISEQMLWTDW